MYVAILPLPFISIAIDVESLFAMPIRTIAGQNLNWTWDCIENRWNYAKERLLLLIHD
jgi:hypothetical protein